MGGCQGQPPRLIRLLLQKSPTPSLLLWGHSISHSSLGSWFLTFVPLQGSLDTKFKQNFGGGLVAYTPGDNNCLGTQWELRNLGGMLSSKAGHSSGLSFRVPLSHRSDHLLGTPTTVGEERAFSLQGRVLSAPPYFPPPPLSLEDIKAWIQLNRMANAR